jgi:hypothetical protein
MLQFGVSRYMLVLWNYVPVQCFSVRRRPVAEVWVHRNASQLARDRLLLCDIVFCCLYTIKIVPKQEKLQQRRVGIYTGLWILRFQKKNPVW